MNRLNGASRRVCVALAVVFMIAACGAIDEEQEPVETQQAALGAFGNWNNLPTGALRWGASVAASNTVGTTLFGVGTDNEVYVTNNREPGGFGALWRRMSTFGLPCCDHLTPGFVSATGLTGEPSTPGALGNTFALAYWNSVTHLIYIRIQDQTGARVVSDWAAIPSSYGLSMPAIAWLPRNSASGSRRTLLLLATDGATIFIAANNVANGVYNHGAWSTFSPILAGPLPTLVSGPPAISWVCPVNSSDYSLVVAVSRVSPIVAAQRVASYTKYNASTGGWSPWITVQNGVFTFGGVALAPGCGEFNKEVSLFGQGTDNRVWVSGQISGGPATFTPIGTRQFAPELPGDARGTSRVGAGFSSGVVFVTNSDVQVPVINSAIAP